MSTSENVITKEDYEEKVKRKEGVHRKKCVLYMSSNAQEIGQIYAKGVLHAFVFTSISCEKIHCKEQLYHLYITKLQAMDRHSFYIRKVSLQGLGQNTSISMRTWVNKSYPPRY